MNMRWNLATIPLLKQNKNVNGGPMRELERGKQKTKRNNATGDPKQKHRKEMHNLRKCDADGSA